MFVLCVQATVVCIGVAKHYFNHFLHTFSHFVPKIPFWPSTYIRLPEDPSKFCVLSCGFTLFTFNF